MLHGYGWRRRKREEEEARRLRATPDVQFLCKLAPAQVLVLRGVSCVTSYATFCRLDSLQDSDTPARVSYLDEISLLPILQQTFQISRGSSDRNLPSSPHFLVTNVS